MEAGRAPVVVDDDTRFAKFIIQAQRNYIGPDGGVTGTDNNVTVQQFVAVVVNNAAFDRAIMLTILVNSLFIALKTFPNVPIDTISYQIADIVFLVLYTAEFLLKVVAFGKAYFDNSFNRFDFFVLLVSIFDFTNDAFDLGVAGDIAFLRVFRALRAIRALRSVSFVRSLQIIVVALLKTIYSIGSLLVLLILIMYIFAVAGLYLFGQDVPDNVENNWGDLATAMYVLWDMVTCNNWTNFQQNLDQAYPGQEGSRVFTSTFIFVGNFVFANLFIGIVIENLDQAQAEEQSNRNSKRNSLLYRKKRSLKNKQEQELVDLLESPKRPIKEDDVDVQANLEGAYQQLQASLRSDDLRIMRVPCCHTIWIEACLNTLKFQDNCLFRSQQLAFEIADTFVSLFECNLGIQQTKQAMAPRPFVRSKSLLRAHAQL